MRAVLLDTHAWAWSLYESSRLSPTGRASVERSGRVLVSSITFYEIAQKVRLGKWPQMEPFVDDLLRLSESQGARIAALRPEICLQAGSLAWPHRIP